MIANYRQAVQVAEPEPEINYIEFIKSTGTQYIDTGFKPNNNTRAVIVFEPDESIKNGWYFGARTSTSSSDRFCLLSDDSGKKIRSDFGSNNTNTNVSPSGKMTVDKNKNVTTINGDQVFTSSNATFSTNYNLYLFAGNSGGEVFSPIPIYLYSFELYDNDVLVRDYAPVLDPEGVACLYDKVSEEYVYNSGSGSFTAGPVISGEGDTNTLLLLHGEDISDSSMYHRSIQNNGNVIVSSVRGKFGYKSLYFDGDSWLTVPGIPFPNEDSDFTVEWWQYLTTAPRNTASVVSRVYTSTSKFGFVTGYYHSTDNNINTWISTGTSSWDVLSFGDMGDPILNAWQHFAVVRSGNTLMLFNNGQKITETTKSFSFGSFERDLHIGRWDSATDALYDFIGYINELRISNVARWTSNFTPPTAPYES